MLVHWDAIDNDAINFLELDEDGASETKSLILDEGLSHERGVELIRELAR
jgi:hypothetical protein